MSIADAAASYTILGWWLVPLRPGSKAPWAVNQWQDTLASNDEQTVRPWFVKQPGSGLGVVLGLRSNVVDVEADCEEGQATVNELVGECLTPTWDSLRGTHRLFRPPVGVSLGQAVATIRGIEFRFGEGGASQSAIPPTIHPSGKQLQWRTGLSPFDVVPAPFPDSLAALITAKAGNGEVPMLVCSDNNLATAPGAAQGERNKQLCILVGHYLKEHGADETLEQLALAFAARCQPPYPPEEALKTVRKLAARHVAKAQPQAITTPRPSLASLRFAPFPVHVLPEPLQSFTRAAAKSVSCDESFIALPVLGTCAAAIGNSVRLGVKPDWEEPALLWTGIVGPPGDRKTPAIAAATEPLMAIQQELQEVYKTQRQQHDNEKLLFEVELKTWKTRAAKTTNPEPPPLMVEAPNEPRLWADDATIEALGALLEANPRGLLLRKDELTAWLKSFGEYKGKGGDLQRWLSIHNTSTVSVDRKGTDTIHLPLPNVSIVGGIQPALLQSFFQGEHVAAGLMQRFLFAWPPPKPAKLTRHGIGARVKSEYASLLTRLQQVPFNEVSAVVPLSEDAWQAFEQWHDHIENEFKPSVDGILREVGSKLVAVAVRLAGIIHCVTDACAMEISPESMRAGILLASWFLAEWQRVHDLQSESFEQQADRQLVEYIVNKHGGGITARNLCRGKWRIKSVGQAEQELMRLVANGWGILAPEASGPQGGRPSCVFTVATGIDIDETS